MESRKDLHIRDRGLVTMESLLTVVMMAPLGTNQSERSKFSLDQSESRISPM